MDRKKTIVAAVMINAAILTVLFIAAMTTREVPLEGKEMGHAVSSPKPLFQEVVEIPASVSSPVDIPKSSPTQSVAFSLPLVDLVEQKHPIPIPAEASSAPLAAAPLPAPAIPANSILSSTEIEVQKGDSLEKLAKKYLTSIDEIIKLNRLPSSFLKVGQRLKIPAEKTHEVPKQKSVLSAAGDNTEYYTMKVGDNPWSIAMRHHMKVDELLKLNGLNEKTARKLKPGDRLRIR